MTVYTPREDSILLKEYLEDLELKGKKILDMGTGSGIIAITAAQKGANVTATDINPEALEYARQHAKDQGVEDKIDFIESNLFENVTGKFDFALFNPPYLPGEKGIGDEEIWRGGEEGVEVTRRFLEAAPKHLSENGEIIVVLSSHADYSDIIEGYDLEIVDSEKLWFETLYLARSK